MNTKWKCRQHFVIPGFFFLSFLKGGYVYIANTRMGFLTNAQ